MRWFPGGGSAMSQGSNIELWQNYHLMSLEPVSLYYEFTFVFILLIMDDVKEINVWTVSSCLSEGRWFEETVPSELF